MCYDKAVLTEKSYEAMVILKPTAEAEVKKAQAEVEDVFKGSGAKITATQVWGKRPLGYKVKGAVEGYYLLYELILGPAEVKTIQSKLNLNGGVIRCLLTLKRV